ncbi:OsmC family protein [Pseudomonas sp. M30-35]|uniref:OsmC family protein n=1 Tax=Pseudomonas sp. M30-35 TaxID=1981174 RepID=UPI000B3C71D6|nr:OsmC family protein [Pseudomonas sp. M30-35]ARU88369.1 peroxiredoxin [Pseudomonas sp. M30-35]
MSEYTAKVMWQRGTQNFLNNRYSRAHSWLFDGGAQVPASSSPHVVPLPYSDPAAVDPEEAFVASLSSCHMLWFLGIAAKQGFEVDEYEDNPVGLMAKNAQGRIAMTRVTLFPRVTFAADKNPTHEQLTELHHKAHDQCFIANSVLTTVDCQPVLAVS